MASDHAWELELNPHSGPLGDGKDSMIGDAIFAPLPLDHVGETAT